MISEEQNMELRRQWQAFYENWGYDGRDAAESWWIEWGLLGERAMELQKEAEDQLVLELSNGFSEVGAQQMQIVMSQS